jgi:hypothetical protein
MTRERLTEIIREVLTEEIRKINGKYVVYPKVGGKRLGTHDTRVEAEKQLTAIHLNKEVMEPADPSKVDPKELKMGIKVEMEHTNDPKKAEKIALQHLAEDPKYYTKLTVAGLEEGPHDAMNPGILSKDSSLKGEDGKIKISKVRQKLSSMKDKGSTKAKALRRFINYHD